MMTKVNSKKRGFTVVELVVALAIILIVSATAIATIDTQNTVHLRTLQTVEATNMAENAIECFRWADSVEEFEEAYGKTLKTSNIELSDKKTKENPPTYTFEKNGMTVTIKITTTKIENEEILHELNFEAVAKDNDKPILKESYTK